MYRHSIRRYLPRARVKTLIVSSLTLILGVSVSALYLPIVWAIMTESIFPVITAFSWKLGIIGLSSFVFSKSAQLFFMTTRGKKIQRSLVRKFKRLKIAAYNKLKEISTWIFNAILELASILIIDKCIALFHIATGFFDQLFKAYSKKLGPYVVVFSVTSVFMLYKTATLFGIFNAVFTAVAGEMSRWAVIFVMFSMVPMLFNTAVNVVLFVLNVGFTVSWSALQLALYLALGVYRQSSLGTISNIILLGVAVFCSINASKITQDSIVAFISRSEIARLLYENIRIAIIEISEYTSILSAWLASIIDNCRLRFGMPRVEEVDAVEDNVSEHGDDEDNQVDELLPDDPTALNMRFCNKLIRYINQRNAAINPEVFRQQGAALAVLILVGRGEAKGHGRDVGVDGDVLEDRRHAVRGLRRG